MKKQPPLSIEDKDKIVIGKFGRTKGLSGWIRVQSFTRPKINIVNYSPLQLSNGNNLQVEKSTQDGKGILVLLKDYDDIDKAATLTNNLIYISKNLLPKLEPGQYYWHDLEGLNISNTKGEHLGIIDYLYDAGHCDLIVVKRDKKQELLIPYEKDVVTNIDLEKNTMLVNWEDF